jgi:hypothetical protein
VGNDSESVPPSVLVFERALKHDLTEDQILHAWRNAFAAARIERDNGSVDFVALGFDQSGRPLEMAAREKSLGVLIYHTSTPPTPRAFRELGLTGR